MPTLKNENKAAQRASVPAEPVAINDERAQAIAVLVRGGMPYAEAVASIDRSPAAPPVAAPAKSEPVPAHGQGEDDEDDAPIPVDPGETLEVVKIPNVAPKGDRMIDFLYELRGKIERSRDRKDFELTITLPQSLFDWVLYSTIAEAQYRGRENLTIEDFVRIKLKELKATDPTGGGRRNPSASGPKDSYNPQTGKWS